MMLFSQFRLAISLSVSCIALSISAMDLDQELRDAAFCGNLHETQGLIAKGANVNAQGENGYTALILAATMGYKNIVEVLLNHRANVNTPNKLGNSALVLAARGGYKNVAGLLLKYYADRNAQDKNGWTSLMWSAFCGNKAIVQLLLLNHADIQVTDREGKSAIDIAREGASQAVTSKERESFRQIVALLARASARQKIDALRELAVKRYAEQYPGVPVCEIIKYLT